MKNKKKKKVMNILELTFKELLKIFKRNLDKYEEKKELKKLLEKLKD